MKVATEGDRNR